MSRDKLKIYLADHAGFCMGVRRALKETLDAADDSDVPRPVRTEGPLIHNRQVLEVLDRKDVSAREEDDEEGGTVLIRAHGVPPSREDKLENEFDRVIDATCPHVKKVQNIAREYSGKGYHCVIVGDPGHAEVEGVLSYADGRGVVVDGPEAAEDLPEMDQVVVVAQTTQDEQVFQAVVDRIKEDYPDCEVFDTICRATHRRQAEAKELAGQVDAMIVVGGYNSANTRRLAEICEETGTTTYHVETEDELPLENLMKCETIGVTAGASTPNWMIRRVMTRLESEHQRQKNSLRHLLSRLVTVPVRFNILVGGAAAAMTWVNAILLEMSGASVWIAMMVACLFVMTQHLLHQYSKRETMYLDQPDRGDFIREKAGALLRMGLACGAAGVVLAFLLGWWPFALVVLGNAVGLVYCLPPHRQIGWLGHLGNLRNIPGSKELFVGGAWAVMTALVPALARSRPDMWGDLSRLFTAGAFVFLFAFHRALLTDMNDVEGDQLAGRETLAVVLGGKKSCYIVEGLLTAAVILLCAAGLVGWTPPVSYVMVGAVGYGAGVSTLFNRGQLPQGELGEALIDGQFYVCALLVMGAEWMALI